ncbi:MAG: MDR family MFS transporter [Steroidobacterales bacterium]
MNTASALPRSRQTLIAISTTLATLLYTVDITIANVALPQIRGSLQATQDQVFWVLTSYIVASAIVTPLTTFLAARFGSRRVLTASVVGFTACSMLCGLATSLPELVIFRTLQGISGAALVPISQSVLLGAYAREDHGRAFAIWSLGVMVGPVVGPTLGGYLTDMWSWRWVFYVNVPVGALAALGIAAAIPRDSGRSQVNFDLFGYVLLALGLGALQLFMDRGADKGWFESGEILLEAGLAFLFAYLFIAHSATTRHPFIEPALLRDRNFVAAILVMLMIGLMFISSTALVPTYLQQIQGYPVLSSGELMVWRGVGMMIATIAGGRLVNRVGPRNMMITAALLLAASMWPLAHISLDTTANTIASTSFFQGAALGLTFLPVNVAAFASLEPRLRTEGTVILTLARNLGSAVGVSVVAAQISELTAYNQSRLVEYFSALDWERWRIVQAVAPGHEADVANAVIGQQSAVIAFGNVFYLMMIAALALIPLVLLFRTPKTPPPTPSMAEGADQLT